MTLGFKPTMPTLLRSWYRLPRHLFSGFYLVILCQSSIKRCKRNIENGNSEAGLDINRFVISAIVAVLLLVWRMKMQCKIN